MFMKVEKSWFRKYHWDCSPCAEPEKKCAMDRNMFQDGCDFLGSRTMTEQNQRPYHKVSEIFDRLNAPATQWEKRERTLC